MSCINGYIVTMSKKFLQPLGASEIEAKVFLRRHDICSGCYCQVGTIYDSGWSQDHLELGKKYFCTLKKKEF